MTTIIITVDDDGKMRTIINGSDREVGNALIVAAEKDPQILGAALLASAAFLKENHPPSFTALMEGIEKIRPGILSRRVERGYSKPRNPNYSLI